MGIRSILSKSVARWVIKEQIKSSNNPIHYQNLILKKLVNTAKMTAFGQDYFFKDIDSYSDFKNAVPIKDYEGLKPYIDKILEGQHNVLWPKQPLYLAKTSGTTSGSKYIPITKESIPNHINSARNALLSYIYETQNGHFLDGKLMFLSGSPEVEKKHNMMIGRLSGIVNHHVPNYLRTNQLPSYPTNCIEDWEQKIEQIVEETYHQNMTLISGIPPWVQMYFDKLNAKCHKKIKDIFPNFQMFVYGGVNFEPYRAKLFESIGKVIPSIETYPASEGFIAYQDSQKEEGLLLLVNSGIFFEFIPVSEYFNDNPTRLSLEEVQLDVNYALIINSNAGLWGYSIGDTIKFVSLRPPRIVVSGRIKHFISAFGEHVIGEEVEKAMKIACEKHPEVEIIEFTVAPNVTPAEGLPKHEWYIAFANPPLAMSQFEQDLDSALCQLNSYYNHLVTGAVLKVLEIVSLQPDAFILYMKSKGKLGGQNKVPRLSNDRNIANDLVPYTI